MRTMSGTLADHLASKAMTLAWCWKLTRKDGTIYRYTTLDTDVTVIGETYLSAVSFLPTTIDAKNGLNVDNAECSLYLDVADVTKADIDAEVFDGSVIDYFRINWNDPNNGIEWLAKGWGIGQIEIGDYYAKFEMRSKSQKLAQIISRRVEGRCYWQLGVMDTPRSYCPVNIDNYTVVGNITSVTNRKVIADSGRIEATDVFKNGKITFTSGANEGYSMEVDSYDPTTKIITLFLNLPYEVEVGDTYSLQYGCDKTFKTCRTVYAVPAYFGGFPHVPDKDRALQYKIKTSIS